MVFFEQFLNHRGTEDQRHRGPEAQRTRGTEDQRTRGPEDQRTRGPEDTETAQRNQTLRAKPLSRSHSCSTIASIMKYDNLWLCLKSQNLTWTQSVPPRGSGWVRSRCARFAKFAAHAPTRYREVVLTGSNSESGLLRQSHNLSSFYLPFHNPCATSGT